MEPDLTRTNLCKHVILLDQLKGNCDIHSREVIFTYIKKCKKCKCVISMETSPCDACERKNNRIKKENDEMQDMIDNHGFIKLKREDVCNLIPDEYNDSLLYPLFTENDTGLRYYKSWEYDLYHVLDKEDEVIHVDDLEGSMERCEMQYRDGKIRYKYNDRIYYQPINCTENFYPESLLYC